MKSWQPFFSGSRDVIHILLISEECRLKWSWKTKKEMGNALMSIDVKCLSYQGKQETFHLELY